MKSLQQRLCKGCRGLSCIILGDQPVFPFTAKSTILLPNGALHCNHYKAGRRQVKLRASGLLWREGWAFLRYFLLSAPWKAGWGMRVLPCGLERPLLGIGLLRTSAPCFLQKTCGGGGTSASSTAFLPAEPVWANQVWWQSSARRALLATARQQEPGQQQWWGLRRPGLGGGCQKVGKKE